MAGGVDGATDASSAGALRLLNLWILRYASIQANTFPSAHVAASLAVSLALIRLLPVVGLAFLWLSVSIAAGTVVGRYHYAADALLGAVLAGSGYAIARLLFGGLAG